MPKNKRKRAPKTVLRLPDLEQSRSAVLNSLASQSSQRSYDHAIREFIGLFHLTLPPLRNKYCPSPKTSDSFDPVEGTFSLVIAVLALDGNGMIVSRQGERLAGRADRRQQQQLVGHGTEYRGSFPTGPATTGRVIVLDSVTGRIGSVTLGISPLVYTFGK
jgi:hypothetical protein